MNEVRISRGDDISPKSSGEVPASVTQLADETGALTSLHFREMIDALPAAIYTTDAQGRITHFNPAAAAFAGRVPKLGTDEWCVTWKLFYPDGTPMPHDQCPMAIALKEGRAIRGAEAIAERPDGTRIWFMPYPTPLRDDAGRIVGAINMLVDITERKQDEQVLLLSEERYRSLIAATASVVWTTDASGHFIVPQPSWEEYTGQAWPEHAGAGWMAMIHPDDREAARARVEKAVREHSLYASTGRLWHGPSKSYRWYEARAVPLFHPDGSLREWIGTVTDVDERKRTEQALRENQERLATELAATQRLQSISTRLIQKDNSESLHEQILDAAMIIMDSQFASIQLLYPERGLSGELRLLGYRGFTAEAAAFWEWVNPVSETSCGIAMRTHERLVIPNVLTCDFLAGSADLRMFLQTGIQAMQSTPLVSRSGGLLGMVSTHWRKPHQPAEWRLRLLDVLARQAADLLEIRQAGERQSLLINELNHRVKNSLATVQSMAAQTFRDGKNSAEARAIFDSRLAALARAHDVLTSQNWQGADLGDVVDHALAPFQTARRRFAIEGPTVRLSPKQALALAMALHELATNALKYGALSNESGRVRIAWSIAPLNGSGELHLTWTEAGGPRVASPKRKGFGSRLIERNLAHELGGDASIEYRPDGVLSIIKSPLEMRAT